MMLERALGMVLLRPYVFAFLIAFVAIATVQMGWRRMAVFSVIGYLFGFGSEALSLRTGVPFGHYEYFSQATIDKELWACGVPVMASLSFVFLAYAGLAMALVARGKVDRRGPGMRFVDLRSTLRSPAVLLLAASFTTVLDVVIDPVSLQGEKWFLGNLYRYEADGLYFGIPLSNTGGWLLVSLLIVGTFQLVDRWLNLDPDGHSGGAGQGVGRRPPAWPGVGLYAGVLAFNVAVTFAIGDYMLGLVSTLVSLVVVGWVGLRFVPRPEPGQAGGHGS